MNIKFGLAGFIPHRLEIKGLPEFSDFSINILFGSHAVINGEQTMGTAIYLPDLFSYKEAKKVKTLAYYNIYDSEKRWKVVLEYDKVLKIYTGTKYCGGEEISVATGAKWNMFFAHLTMGGLSKGENCLFEKVSQKP